MHYLTIILSFLKLVPGLLKIQISVLGEDGRFGGIYFVWADHTG
jgi:hypothetical protein